MDVHRSRFLIPASAQKRLFSHLDQYPLTNGDQLTFNWAHPHQNKFYRSMLKSAFLKCFEIFGYDFVFSATAARMRKVINGEMVHPSEHNFGVYFQRKDRPHKEGLYKAWLLGNRPYYVCYFTLEVYSEKQTVFIIIPSNNTLSWRNMSILPSYPDGCALEIPMMEVPDWLSFGKFYAYSGRSGPAQQHEYLSQTPE